jgi:hypothetical protein
MEATFLSEARRLRPGATFDVLALCLGSFYDEEDAMDPRCFLMGWLNRVPPGGAASMTTFAGPTPPGPSLGFAVAAAAAAPRVVELCDVDLPAGELGPDMLVGVVAFQSGPAHCITMSLCILAQTEEWRRWWRAYRTVPNARLLAAILYNFEKDTQMALAQAGALAAFAPKAPMDAWLAEKETTGTACALPMDDKWRPLFRDGDAVVCMDAGTGEVASLACAHAEATARGGIFVGLPGSGKFSRLLAYMKGAGGGAAAVGASAGASAGEEAYLRSRATLILVPENSCQWRLRQLSARFPQAIVLFRAAHFRNVTWHDILTAEVVIMCQHLFHTKWYARRAQAFVTNVYECPEEAAGVLRGMAPSVAAPPPKKRRRAAAVLLDEDLASSFFERPGGDKDMPLSSKTRSVSYQLAAASAAGSAWSHVLNRPVMQVIHFARVVAVDVQQCTARQREVVAHLYADVKWATDAATTPTAKWDDRMNRWEVVLPQQLYAMQSVSAKYALLRAMAAELEPRPVVYYCLHDTLTPALRDRFRQDADEPRVTAACICPQYRKIVVFLPPGEVVAAVLLEQERGLLAAETVPRLVSDDDSGSPPLAHPDDSSYSSDDDSRGGSDDEDSCEDEEGDSDPAYAEAIAQSLADLGSAVRIPATRRRSAADASPPPSPPSPPSPPAGADAVSSADVPTAHEREQLALAARVHATLRGEIGKEACKICATSLASGLLSCGHAFCGACVFNWLESEMKPSCPVCMRVFASPEPPFFVPLMMHSLPLPAWARVEDSCAWARDVCGGVETSAAFWCYTRLRLAEAAGQPLVLMVDTAAEVKALAEKCGEWAAAGAAWRCGAHTGGWAARQTAEKQFAAKRQHVAISQEDILAGCSLEGATEILNLCEAEVAYDAVSLRLGRAMLTFRSCVYSEEAV